MKLFSSTSTLQQTFLVLFFCGFAISFGQDFSGNYIRTGINGNASLQLEFDGATYSGVMGFGREAMYVEGELEGLELEGFLSFGEKVDGFFTAAKEANQILLYYAFLKPDGSVDETTVQEIIFFEQASDNPLESSPNSSQSINSASTTLSGELIQYGVLYSAGARLKSEPVGLSFTVPNTGQAIYVAEQGFVFGHSGLLGGGVQLIALSSGNLSAIVTSLLSIDPETEQLIPLGNIEQTQ